MDEIEINNNAKTLRDKVWACIKYINRTGDAIDSAVKLYNITIEDYEKHKATFPS